MDSGVAIRLPAIKHHCVMRQITRDEARLIAEPCSAAFVSKVFACVVSRAEGSSACGVAMSAC